MQVPLVSITRLHLAGRWRFPQFLFHSLRSIAQARRTPGYLGGWTSNDAENGFWTATVWENAAAMRAFRNSGAHLKAMPKLLHLSDQAAFTHFEQSVKRSADARCRLRTARARWSAVQGERTVGAAPRGPAGRTEQTTRSAALDTETAGLRYSSPQLQPEEPPWRRKSSGSCQRSRSRSSR